MRASTPTIKGELRPSTYVNLNSDEVVCRARYIYLMFSE